MIPSFIFIVPYRDREEHMEFFKKHMTYILEDIDSSIYKIYFVHQCDQRSFNRGAMKNIGFLAMKNKYPEDYQNITFVFNDIDTVPLHKNVFDYKTTESIVKHFYGFHFALGGIVSVLGKDFEKMNGFPNFWGWGYEDNLLQKRVGICGFTIDRSQFFNINDPNMIQLNHGKERIVNRKDFQLYSHSDPEGISDIKHLTFIEDDMFIQVSTFSTGRNEMTNLSKVFDITTGNVPFKTKRKMTPTIDMLLPSPVLISPVPQSSVPQSSVPQSSVPQSSVPQNPSKLISFPKIKKMFFM
jgi:hypothetical protein